MRKREREKGKEGKGERDRRENRERESTNNGCAKERGAKRKRGKEEFQTRRSSRHSLDSRKSRKRECE
jgi:hypothetical protein